MTTYIFGDSFTGCFTLVKNPAIKIKKYKGATIKGLTKETNDNRKSIIDTIKNAKNINCLIFNFGNVDVHMSFYYKLIYFNEMIDYKDMVKKYVEFINNIKCNCNKIVIGVYQSPLKVKNVIESLYKYGVIKDTGDKAQNTKNEEKIKPYIKLEKIYKRFKIFNDLLEKECKKYNIQYEDIDYLIRNKNNKMVLDDKFIDISQYNIHLRWKPLIKIWVSRLNKCGISGRCLVDIEKEEKRYLEHKTELINRGIY